MKSHPKKLSCCGELELFGHASTCSNKPVAPVVVRKAPRARHLSSSPTACIYCGSETRKGSLDLGEGHFAHAKCERAACQDDEFSNKINR